jgi:hypothetical protein
MFCRPKNFIREASWVYNIFIVGLVGQRVLWFEGALRKIPRNWLRLLATIVSDRIGMYDEKASWSDGSSRLLHIRNFNSLAEHSIKMGPPHATSSLLSRRLAIIVVVIKSQLQSRSHLGQRHNVLPSENISCTSQHSETYMPETGASWEVFITGPFIQWIDFAA